MGARGPLSIVGGPASSELSVTVAEQVPMERPRPPAWVAKDEDLATLWEETVEGLDRAGLLAAADAQLIETACRHTMVARMAYEEVRRTGTVVVPATDDGVEKKHPAEAVLRMESAAALEALKQMGATWMSRARTAAAAPKEESGGNPFGAIASGE